ncbi:alkaline shock response membrane anchor protein AmaP [Streptococcus entericus]|uniref:alkaline shock response membrane anchor protein AmaP n=1 Tax=Streptococcus entericus TaxID=155680 RepID=UPI0003773D90|nr:alkaline shock response membrane anchor protein AmaP [Streptococcus entericus]
MSKLTKLISIVTGIVLLTLLLPLLVTSALDANVPPQLLALRDLSGIQFPFRHLIATYTFWVALALIVAVFIGILVIIFFPRLQTELPLAKKDGQLVLSKSAIDGLVKSVVQEHGLMKTPTIKTKLYKRRFKVKVTGDVVPKYDVVNRTNHLKSDIERTLREFVGVEQPIDLVVVVKQVDKTGSSKQSRVI